jgi:hypothetical protein
LTQTLLDDFDPRQPVEDVRDNAHDVALFRPG